MLTVLKRGLTSCLNTPIHRLNSPQTDVTLLVSQLRLRPDKNSYVKHSEDAIIIYEIYG